MSIQPEVNTAHVAEAGLDINDWPDDGDGLLEWAKAMTKRDGDTVVRSGIMMTGSGVQPTVTWGIVAEQMGFQRISNDFTSVCVNPEAGKAAMQWVLDLFDTHRVSTRDVTDRYKAFGTGQGSIFWTGPWTINGYLAQELPFATKLFPKVGEKRVTYFERGALELYIQSDPSRYQATMDAVTWLSDNSFLWCTEGRGGVTAAVDSRPQRLQDGRSPLGCARGIRRWPGVRDCHCRFPDHQRRGLQHLFRWQLPGEDPGTCLGRSDIH